MDIEAKTVASRGVAAQWAAEPAELRDLGALTPLVFGAAAFQQLNAGCELGLFDLLFETGGLTAGEIGRELGLAPLPTRILLLGTTALGLTDNVGGRYSNSGKLKTVHRLGMWQEFKDVVAFEQHIGYVGRADYSDSLRADSNVGLRRVPGEGRDLYHRLAENPHMESVFYKYMRSWSELAAGGLIKNFPITGVTRVLDAGGGDAVNAILLAQAHPSLRLTVMEIPATAAKITRPRIEEANLSHRIDVIDGDMFKDEFPRGYDCITFIHQLVIWTPEQNTELLRKAYEALPEGGRVVIYSSVSKDDGSGPLMAALDSVYFASLPTKGGMIYAARDYESWLREVGFEEVQFFPCDRWTPHGMVVGQKA
jgi:L-tyrosine C(3)-methyltransferase